MKFTLTSPEFKEGDTLNSSYQVDQDNQSPELLWKNAPATTKSFAIAMHDPDAPTGGAGWWHWLAFNIPKQINRLQRNAGCSDGTLLPVGVRQMKNDGGSLGYMGCYPPEGDPAHRYIFTIYALDIEQPKIATDASTSMAGFIINAHTIAKASLTGYLAR